MKKKLNPGRTGKAGKTPKDGVRQLKGVTITARKSKGGTSVLKGGAEVSNRKIDSVRRANPSAGKAIGSGYIGSGGKRTYGAEQSDVIRGTVKGIKK